SGHAQGTPRPRSDGGRGERLGSHGVRCVRGPLGRGGGRGRARRARARRRASRLSDWAPSLVEALRASRDRLRGGPRLGTVAPVRQNVALVTHLSYTQISLGLAGAVTLVA